MRPNDSTTPKEPNTTCAYCGKAYHARLRKERPAKRHFCSTVCRYGSQQAIVRCAGCGTDFRRALSRIARADAQYCTAACWKRSIATSHPCPTCGGVVQRSDTTYCSPVCASVALQRRITFACDHCGKEVAQPLSQYNAHKSHVCSPACHNALRRETMRGQANPAYRQGGMAIICAQCGATVEKAAHQVVRRTHSFCNSTCYGLWQRERFTGPASPAWRGGHDKDRGPNWSRQSRAARERDGHTCQLCGATRLVHAHHIIPFRHFQYIRGTNDHYKAANVLTNLISLCASCHQRVEHGTLALPPR